MRKWSGRAASGELLRVAEENSVVSESLSWNVKTLVPIPLFSKLTIKIIFSTKFIFFHRKNLRNIETKEHVSTELKLISDNAMHHIEKTIQNTMKLLFTFEVYQFTQSVLVCDVSALC